MSTEMAAMPSSDRQIAQGAAWIVAARLTVWGDTRPKSDGFKKRARMTLTSPAASLLVAVSLRHEWMAATPKRSLDGPKRDVPRHESNCLGPAFCSFWRSQPRPMSFK